ncbi:MAG: hypothetical protein DKINENOH_04556 [bacterium]|nr:hypothetical protein [bacterium]
MPPDSKSSNKILLDPNQFTIVNIVGMISALITIILAVNFSPQLAPFIAAFFGIGLVVYLFLKRWRVRRELPNEFSAKDAIREAARHYIPPYCSETDPTQRDASNNPKAVSSDTQPMLFDEIDKFINETPHEPYLWLLGDSGTGKSSFVLNYYARNRRRRWWQRQRLYIVRLGLPEPQEHIMPVRKKAKTVLFLDGFDEDTKAADDYEARFDELMGWCREFKRVLITCRTQFFPSDDAMPCDTQIPRTAVRSAGTSPNFKFSKLYIAPFTDEQVKAYLEKRFPFKPRKQHANALQLKKREEAIAMVKSHAALLQRPMLLAYIPELLERGKTFQHTFQFYEEMVDAWLERDHTKVADKAKLRNFSECLAINLYTNREERGAERVERQLLTQLARDWGEFNLNDWKLSSRSLLNRDAAGYYKFAHRSIMEYLFVKRITAKDTQHLEISRTDQMNAFLLEMVKAKLPEAKHPLLQRLKKVKKGFPAIRLRAQAKEGFNDGDVRGMIQEWGFFDSNRNKEANGFFHLYETSEQKKAKIVIDHATGLMWQQSGSDERIAFAGAEKHIQKLNREKFAGHNDWRLPTLEEAMSLMEPTKKNGDLYIDSVFDKTQHWIWTADKESAGVAWGVYFYHGYCDTDFVDYYNHVRAVRSGQS